ncbi:MAG: YkgJ family cysteine cluster protein [Candidatus Melainabacteria bacterium]|nr:YkgJ family cysteine cluster protein [Candidatus Melainabacteria bacterium]
MSLFTQTLEALDRQTHTLQTLYREHLQCRRGCSRCCETATFRIRYIEALYLLKALTELPPESAQQVLFQLNTPLAGTEQHCPFLLEGACSVYEHRPAICRAYGLPVRLGKDVGICELNFQQEPPPAEGLQVLELAPFYEVLNELSQQFWQQQPLSAVSAASTARAEEAEAPLLSIRVYLQRLLQTVAANTSGNDNHSQWQSHPQQATLAVEPSVATNPNQPL